MLDIKFIRENKQLIQDGARKKHIDFDVEKLIRVDDKRRELLQEVEEMRARQNKASEEISRTEDGSAKQKLIDEVKGLKEELSAREEKLKQVMEKWQRLMIEVPNIPDMSVPEGESDEDNQEIRTWGDIPQFSFTPKSHIDLMNTHDMADFERGTKVAGFRGYFLKGDAMNLSFALWQYVLDELRKKEYAPIMVPSLVNREPFMGTGYLPQSEEDLYKTQDNTYLSGTGEVAMMGYHMDETLTHTDLPQKFIGFSPCYRREAGSYGKDTKGLMRVHEFFKLEQVILCEANHETSVKYHEELRENAEQIMQGLGIPYRLVVNCGGDLGLGQVKKYDIEAWVPSEEQYRETHSASYFHDFQSRRLNIKYKDTDGNTRFVHSLNNTAIATPRLLISLIENYQNEDGSITIPEVLRPYMGGRTHMPAYTEPDQSHTDSSAPSSSEEASTHDEATEA